MAKVHGMMSYCKENNWCSVWEAKTYAASPAFLGGIVCNWERRALCVFLFSPATLWCALLLQHLRNPLRFRGYVPVICSSGAGLFRHSWSPPREWSCRKHILPPWAPHSATWPGLCGLLIDVPPLLPAGATSLISPAFERVARIQGQHHINSFL